MATVPHSISLRDADATRDELEALRDVMRSDAPYPDEPPTLEADDDPWGELFPTLSAAQLAALGWAED